MSLSDLKLRSMKPESKPYKKADSEGLYVQVEPGGSMLWRFRYRFAGKQKLLALGLYPTVGLKEARRARDRAKEVLEGGVDPSAVRRAEKKKASATRVPTFRDVGETWAAGKKWSPRYAEQMASRMELNLYCRLGDKPIETITPKMVLETIRVIEDRDALVMARELLAVARNIFQLALVEEIIDRDPTTGMTKALKDPKRVKHHAALRETDLPEFFHRLNRYDGDELTAIGIEFTMHTMVRTNEVLDLEPQDVGDDMWRIPPEKMKMGREHWVYLTPTSQELLARARRINPYGRPFRMSNNTMLYGLYRMGYHKRATMHGMRTLASTSLNESALFHVDWIEKQLAHDEENDSRGAYNAAEYLVHRKAMLRWWSDRLNSKKAEALRHVAAGHDDLDELLSG